MTDATFTCPQCSRTWPYDEADKTLDPDPRTRPTRVICSDCEDVYLETGKPFTPSFNVERNFKKAGTSSQAAQKAAKAAKFNDTHRLIYKLLRERPMTADEVAEVTGIKLLTVRPRMSDLRNPKDEDKNPIAPFAVPTGEERAPEGGEPADVVRVTTAAERASWTPETGFQEQRQAA